MDNDLKLNTTYKCWVQTLARDSNQEYNNTLNEAFTVSTIKEFWKYYQHMNRPSRLKENDNVYIFKEQIHPTWEAEENKDGGCFRIKIKKQRCNRVWEDLILAVISPENKFAGMTNGIRIKIKDKMLDEMEIWMRKPKSEEEKNSLKEYYRKQVFSDEEGVFDFKSFSKR